MNGNEILASSIAVITCNQTLRDGNLLNIRTSPVFYVWNGENGEKFHVEFGSDRVKSSPVLPVGPPSRF